jgi:transcriptional regulator with PAS, ATPase and Fis domain
MRLLEKYNWPGNVRELENAVLHAVSLSDNTIYPEHLPVRIREFEFIADGSRADIDRVEQDGDWQTLADMEAEYVIKVLRSTGNNKQAASRILNIDRKTLSRIANRHGSADNGQP